MQWATCESHLDETAGKEPASAPAVCALSLEATSSACSSIQGFGRCLLCLVNNAGEAVTPAQTLVIVIERADPSQCLRTRWLQERTRVHFPTLSKNSYFIGTSRKFPMDAPNPPCQEENRDHTPNP